MNTSLKLVYPNGSMQEMVEKLLAIMSVFTGDNFSPSPDSIRGFDLGGASIWEIDRFRSQDIPILLECGAFDIGIVGRDWVVERGADVAELGSFVLSRETFNPVRLVLAAPKELGFSSILDLPIGAVIATEYPVTTRKYLKSFGRNDLLVQLSYGQTELKPKIGAATAIVDITETGRSLRANGLEIMDEICQSTMTICSNKQSFQDEKKRQAIIRFTEMVGDCYNLMLLDERRG